MVISLLAASVAMAEGISPEIWDKMSYEEKMDAVMKERAQYLERKRIQAIKDNQIREAAISRQPMEFRQPIRDRRIVLEMTSEQVILSWGNPHGVNKSVGNWGVHEQWIYGRTYLYFENGFLKSYQTSK